MSMSAIAYPNDVQQKYTSVLAKINDLVTSVSAENVPTDVSEKVSEIEQALAQLEQYASMLNRKATATYESISDVGGSPSVGNELGAARQRFETTAHLAKQSRSAYLRQRKIMWLWVMFAVVLGGCLVYMYIWITGLGAAAETGGDHSIASVPDKRELFDTDFMKPSALFDDDADGAADDADADGAESPSVMRKASRKFARMFSKREDTAAVEADGAGAGEPGGLLRRMSSALRGDAKNDGEPDSDGLFGDMEEKTQQ